MTELRSPALPPPPPAPVFSELADAVVVWAPVEEGAGEREMRLGDGSWRHVLPCRNPSCRGGGYDLAFVVEGMLPPRETENRGLAVCPGWEGEGAADPASGTPCVRAIRYHIRLVYRGPVTPPLPGAATGPGGGVRQ